MNIKVKQRLASIESTQLDIPFRHVFRHASAARDKTTTLWVKVTSIDNLVGYGEGCPREYVTGESLAGAMRFIQHHRASLIATVGDLESVKEWMSKNTSEVNQNPAAWCALELALLDLISRQANVPIEDYLGVPCLGQTFDYTAVIGVTNAEQCSAMLAKYQQLDMWDYKIKLSGDLQLDNRNIAMLHATQPERVRVDANNLWADLAIASDYLAKLDYPFFAIEEPFQAGRFDLMEELGAIMDTRIILDESILRIEQLDHLMKNPKRWIVNIRVSKMGGLIRSLSVIAKCRACGIPVIIGAQVGETSLLTRAGLTLANAARDILIAQEGAFGTYLLESDPCEPELKFSVKGRLDIKQYGLNGQPGLGLHVKKQTEITSLMASLAK